MIFPSLISLGQIGNAFMSLVGGDRLVEIGWWRSVGDIGDEFCGIVRTATTCNHFDGGVTREFWPNQLEKLFQTGYNIR